ncbi:MAG: DUF3097 domain-containing protein [Propionibacteriaceae bacterium]|nr:DUF3097 domain-containing protein [Propionibacteriaceae bacterium]
MAYDAIAQWAKLRQKKPPTPFPAEMGAVLEDPTSGFCGAITGRERGLVELEDRHGKRRMFPFDQTFWVDGKPVALTLPKAKPQIRRTASGSLVAPKARAKTARESRIYVEGRHDAELVEKVWGDDLRYVGVVVEYLGGADDLAGIVEEFQPGPTRKLGVLLDHLIDGTKETRIAKASEREGVLILGHPYIDIWQAIKPASVGLERWPEIPRGESWKAGICRALGRPAKTQTDIANTWRWLLSRVKTWDDLELPLINSVERLIDFVTG